MNKEYSFLEQDKKRRARILRHSHVSLDSKPFPATKATRVLGWLIIIAIVILVVYSALGGR